MARVKDLPAVPWGILSPELLEESDPGGDRRL
jgi:hypothetical protein